MCLELFSTQNETNVTDSDLNSPSLRMLTIEGAAFVLKVAHQKIRLETSGGEVGSFEIFRYFR